MKALGFIYKWIVKAEEFCSKLLLVAIIILCFISALARYMDFTVVGGTLISIALAIQVVQDIMVLTGRARMEDFAEGREE